MAPMSTDRTSSTPEILQIPRPEPISASGASYGLPPSEDGKSVAESQAMASGTLEQEAARGKHRRDENFKVHVALARKVVFWFLISLFMAMTGALIFHWITPWSFLEKEQLDTIKTIIGAALASKIFAEQAKLIT